MKLNLLIILFCSVAHCKSQTPIHHEFIGSLQLNNGDLIPFKLNYIELDNNKIEGYSITNFFDENSTKSAITGNFTNQRKNINFRETMNISTKSNAAENEFCYVSVEGAKFEKLKNKITIKGSFKGQYKNGELCAEGILSLIESNFLNNITANAKPKQKKGNDSLNAYLAKVNQALANVDVNHINANEHLKVNWQTSEITIEIWDALIEDEDKIQLSVNNQLLLDGFEIKKDKKTLVIPFTSKICEIKILANNEGLSPPNTVDFILKNQKQSIKVVSSLKKGESTLIILEKE